MRWMIVLSLLSGFFLAGCDYEGPAEETGESLDRSMGEAGERIEEGAERLNPQEGVEGGEGIEQ